MLTLIVSLDMWIYDYVEWFVYYTCKYMRYLVLFTSDTCMIFELFARVVNKSFHVIVDSHIKTNYQSRHNSYHLANKRRRLQFLLTCASIVRVKYGRLLVRQSTSGRILRIYKILEFTFINIKYIVCKIID